MRTIHIGVSRSYDVVLDEGLLARVGGLVGEVLRAWRVMIVSDSTVFAIFGAVVSDSFRAAGFEVSSFVFKPGEHSKSLATLGEALNALAGAGFTRGDCVCALGGGVVGDLAGFAAAVYARGIPFVQVPTTLLAAVDSSIGGKTAVNLDSGKNLVGAFWQPSLVLCDMDVMRGLPAELVMEGAAEMIKHAVLADTELFERLSGARPLDQLEDSLARNLSIKRACVEADERDTGIRQTLNLGHTIGHAIETVSDHEYSHGQAVAIGLYRIARAAERMGFAADGLAERIKQALVANGLPFECSIPVDELLAAARLDKKRSGSTTTLVVPRGIGRCELIRVDDDGVAEWFRAGAE
ncbi:3-dehydroquinate synthase [Clostridia bacterium]|nr:3-dehydroquinate synthase [Clostridia bacterium]